MPLSVYITLTSS